MRFSLIKHPLLCTGGVFLFVFSLATSVAQERKPEVELVDNEGKPTVAGKGNPSQKRDAKNEKSGKEAPPQDPELEKYGIYAESAPTPERGEAIETTLPLKLEKDDRIALVGNTLLDRGGQFGFFESMLYQT